MDVGIRNYMEDIVTAKLDGVLAQMDMCTCERCRLDIMAYVLNKMPPKYVVTVKGTMYAKLSLLQSQFDVDVLTNLITAAKLVKERPNHDDH
jgi:competence protein ComFB